ncbi:alpha-D-ribose 1-methylphosphonate 5-triphosphate synthase subunit PhnG [Thalassovita taeanensis]|uniref:Alpha-D-ribose 1-methylphosphonate 5-triphosphate synthase subunit PhnG n=2 Tax=Thalassovita taeanensis TaxID=657014 RepID=A0A1H9BZT0_9RHOB|nr:alpha-D-ribose 1-methylphosphonate 5-triphosphate synthase subunit PhnG [Thalassovita taeanensis]
MSLLAKAPAIRLTALWAAFDAKPAFDWLRAPEVGGAMVRGRMGGTGGAFNLGEMTVTRCSLRLTDGAENGVIGHAYVQGRDKTKAEIAALVDALMQTPSANAVKSAVLEPLLTEGKAAKTDRAAKAAATKVEFFTMVRGED